MHGFVGISGEYNHETPMTLPAYRFKEAAIDFFHS
jgi:hypothetical protein